MIQLNQFYNMDCMDGMRELPDKYIDLLIADPPYFKGPNNRRYYGSEINSLGIAATIYPTIDTWDIPTPEYFQEALRVSKNQIIWGCNYFDYRFGSGRIVWDKCNGANSFSDCEIAYCSLHDSIRLFRFMWNGMMQGKSIAEGWITQGDKSKNEKRIHPTQKPVALYDWILKKYLPDGGTVLDTHVGSASSLIACEKAGVAYIGFEKDTGMYCLARDRLEESQEYLKAQQNQISLF